MTNSDKNKERLVVKPNSQSAFKKNKKVRLFSNINFKVPFPRELIALLPSLSINNEQEIQAGLQDETITSVQSEEETLTREDAINAETLDNSASQFPDDRIEHSVEAVDSKTINTPPPRSSAHLSTKLYPIIHKFLGASYVNHQIHAANQVDQNNQAPHIHNTTPKSETHYVDETLQGKYGTLHVNPDGKYVFTLDPKSPAYVQLQKQEHGTDTFTLSLTNGDKLVIQIPVEGKQDAPTISGDLNGEVREDVNVNENGFISISGKVDVVDLDHDESGTVAEKITGKFGTLTIDSEGHWQYQVDNSQSTIQALTNQTALHESFTIHTTDGTSQIINMTIDGTDDHASITGNNGAVIEDLKTTVIGKLSVHDNDAGQNELVAFNQEGHFGHLTLNKDGTWQYILDNTKQEVQQLGSGENVQEVFQIKSIDGSSHNIIIDVSGTNDAPTLQAQTQAVTEDGAMLNGQMVGQDIDHNASLTYSIANPVDGLTFNPDGSYSFNPANGAYQHLAQGETQTLTIPVTVTDEHGANSTQNLTITLTGTDDSAIIAGQDSGTVTEDKDVQGQNQPSLQTSGTLTITSLDAGKDQFTAAAQAINDPYGGALNIDKDGQWTYHVPNANVQQLGAGESEQVQYQVTSVGGEKHTITITVKGTNDAPTLQAQTQAVTEDGAMLNGQMVGQDIDHNASLTYSIANPVDGLTFNPDGSYSFNPANGAYQHLAQGETQTLTIPVTVTDEYGASSTQNLTITITGTNDSAIIAGQDSGSVTEDKDVQGQNQPSLETSGTLTITSLDAGKDQFTTAAQAINDPYGGALNIDKDGQWTYHVPNANVQHLGAGESEQVQYQVTSVGGEKHTITITVQGTNDAPTLQAQTQAVTEDGAMLNGQMAGQDIDHNASLTYTIASPVDGLTFNPDGSYSFNPANGAYQHLAQGETQTLTIPVTVTDEHGANSTQNLTITITGTNDKAVITGKDTGDVYENQAGQDMSPDYAQPGMSKISHDALLTSGQLNVKDLDKGESSFEPKDGLFSYHGKYGDLLLRSDGHWDYAVSAGQTDWRKQGVPSSIGSEIDRLGTGETLTDTITVQTKDGTTHDIVITIHGDNDAPYVSGEVVLNSGKEDIVQTITQAELLANSIDVDANDQGKLTIANLHVDHGSVIDNHDGTYTFTPEKDYIGKVHFSYEVQDAHGGTTNSGAYLNLMPESDAAVFSGQDYGSVQEDKNLVVASSSTTNTLQASGTLIATDPDIGQSGFEPKSSASAYRSQQGGTLEIDETGNWHYSIDNSKPTIQGLAEGDTLLDKINIHSKDGTSHEIVISIHGTNDAPTLNAQSQVVTEDGTKLIGQMVGQDIDHNATLTYAIANSVDGLTFNPDGSYSFNPANAAYQHLAQGETQTLIIPVTVTDEHGASATQNLTITITGTNDKAVITGQDTGDVTEGHGSFGDMSPDYAQPGMAKLGQAALTVNGKLDITDPDSGESQFDPKGGAWNNSYHGQYGHLLLNSDGTWHYDVAVGNVDWVGNRKTTVGTTIDQLGEGQTLKDIITVYSKDGTSHDIVITIHGSNDRPYVSGEVQLNSGKEDIAQTITQAELLANSIDVDANDKGKLAIANLRADHGSILDNHDGTFTFTPDKDYNGHVHFSYDVKDAHGGITPSGASLSISAAPDNAQISYAQSDNHQGGVTEDRNYIDTHDKLHFEGKLNISDPDTGEAKFDINLGPQTYEGIGYDTKLGGHILLMQDGHYTYTIRDHQPLVQNLKEGESITDECVVRSQDGTTFTIQVSIHGTNDAPTLTAQSQSVNEDGNLLLGHMHGQDIDHDASLTYTIANPIDGLTFNPDGSYSFNSANAAYQHLAQGETQTLTIPVTVTDEYGASATQNLSITITGTNDKAVISGQDTGDVYESAYTDRSPDYQRGNISHLWNDHIHTSGKLDILDSDSGQKEFDNNSPAYQYFGQYGRLILQKDGNWSYYVDVGDSDVGRKIDALNTGENITDTITIRAKDGTTHDIAITIHGDNDAPYVSSEVQLNSGKENLAQTITQAELLANSIDVDANDKGKLTIANLRADHGSILDNQDGTFTFTPDKDFNGHVHFSYDVKDAHGGSTASGASLELVPVNNASTLATGQDTGVVTEDQIRSGTTSQLWSGWSNLDVTDVDGPSDAEIAYIEVNGVQHAVPADFAMSLTANHGYFSTTHSTDGHNKWSYTADNSSAEIQELKSGEHLQDTMVLITKDGTRIPVTATIQGQDDHVIIDTPDALTAAIGTAVEDSKTTVTGILQAHDLDKGDQVSFELAGSAFSQSGSYGTFYVDRDGHWHYDLDAAKVDSLRSGDGRAEVFEIVAISSDGSRATQKVEVLVQGTNDAAIITGADTGIIIEDRNVFHDSMHQIQVTGTLHVTDSDVNENYFRESGIFGHEKAISDPFQGEMHIDRYGNWDYVLANGNPAVQALGQGETKNVIYEVNSADGTPHRIIISVTGTNDAPTVSSEVQLNSGNEDVVQTITAAELLANATDIDNNDQGQLFIANLVADHGSIRDNQDGTYTFTPEKDYHGQVHFTYDVKDAHGGEVHTGASTTLVSTNDAAVFSGQDKGNVTEDLNPHLSVQGNYSYKLEARGSLRAFDPDANENGFEFKTLISVATHPEWTPYRSALGGQLEIDSKGDWAYYIDNRKPEIQHLGKDETLTDTVTVHSKDGTTHDIVITIHGTNDAPIVSSEVQLNSGKQDVVQTITSAELLANATDIDNNDQGQLFIANLVADHGSIRDNQDGTYTFTPEKDYHGQVHFSYDVKDAHGGLVHTGAGIQLIAQDQPLTIQGDTSVNSYEDTDTQGFGRMGLSGWSHFDISDPDSPLPASLDVEFEGKTYTMTLGKELVLHTAEGFIQIESTQQGNCKFNFVADNNSDAVQGLGSGDSVQYVANIKLPDGSKFPLTTTIHGKEDGVQIDSHGLIDSVNESGTLAASTGGQLHAHDSDKDDTVNWHETPSGGVAGNYGTFSLDKDGHWHYTVDPVKAASLAETELKAEFFTVTAESSDGSTSSQRIEIDVHGTNQAPTVSAIVALTSGVENTSLTIHSSDLLKNSVDVDHAFGHQLEIENLKADHGLITDNQDGTFTFIPDKDYSGQVQFTYDVKDAHGAATSAFATMSINAISQSDEAEPLNPEIIEVKLSLDDFDKNTDTLTEQHIEGPQDGVDAYFSALGIQPHSQQGDELQQTNVPDDLDIVLSENDINHPMDDYEGDFLTPTPVDQNNQDEEPHDDSLNIDDSNDHLDFNNLNDPY